MAPIASTDDIHRVCLAVRIRLINRVLTNLYDAALRPHGLRVSQMNVMVAIAQYGVARPGDIGRVLRLEKSTLSRDVERLRTRGWVETVACEDGRAHRLRVTPAGATLLRKVAPAWGKAQDQACEMLGAAGVAAVMGMADAVWSRAERPA